ncbi:MAG: 2Fe-2S iron-sulfur cluster-binding protein [Actinomycetota bacterium]
MGSAIDLTVLDVIAETPDACSLVFEIPEHEEARLRYLPGQFLTIRVPSEERGAVARSYSLSSAPGLDKSLKVTVKRTDGGYASNWLCENVAAGDTVTVLPPSGRFTPEDLNDDLLLFAAGSGITPVISIIKTALATGTARIHLVYANKDSTSVIFNDELADLAARYADRIIVRHWLDAEHGFPTVERVSDEARSNLDSQVYICGPAPFMNTVVEGLRNAGVPRESVHREVFSSLTGDPFSVEAVTAPENQAATASTPAAESGDVADTVVRIAGESLRFPWPRERNLVEVLLERGVEVPYSCRSGECGSCACTVVRGEVAMDRSDILDEEDILSGYILGCQAHPVSAAVEIEF